MEHDNLDKTDGWSRSASLIKQNIKYKRRKYLETQGLATTWIQVGLAGSKNFLIQALYRQFRRQGTPGSNSINSQTARWKQLIEKWETALDENREIITLGDTNLDSIMWEKPWDLIPQYDKNKMDMYYLLRDKILLTGTRKINSEYTRIDHQTQGRKSCLDQIFTNRPEKVNNFTTHHSTFSNHSMVEININVKKKINTKKFIKIRTMKNYNKQTFNENISNHGLYIETMYENQSDKIAENIIQILKESVNPVAPIIRIQMTSRNTEAIGMDAQKALVERDIAQREAKENPTLENKRNHRHLRNRANNLINKERYLRKKEMYEKETSTRQKWKKAKQETGQESHENPSVIKDGNKNFTKPKDIAMCLNRQYITNIRNIIKNIPQTQTNPLKLYKDAVGQIEHKLNIEQINMSQLIKTISNMAATTSATKDYLSMRLLKDAGQTIYPLILHLVNTVIKTEIFPEVLKITKIVPIRKKSKPHDDCTGWRPINILPSLSKIIEKCLLLQISKYLMRHNLIHHTHHGSVSGKGTQTIVQEIITI